MRRRTEGKWLLGQSYESNTLHKMILTTFPLGVHVFPSLKQFIGRVWKITPQSFPATVSTAFSKMLGLSFLFISINPVNVHLVPQFIGVQVPFRFIKNHFAFDIGFDFIKVERYFR